MCREPRHKLFTVNWAEDVDGPSEFLKNHFLVVTISVVQFDKFFVWFLKAILPFFMCYSGVGVYVRRRLCQYGDGVRVEKTLSRRSSPIASVLHRALTTESV